MGSVDQLRQSLLSSGLYLLAASEKKSVRVKKLSDRELSDFCRELSSMLSAGISLSRSMNIIMERDLTKNLNIVFRELNIQINRGNSLSEAMVLQSGAFPDLLVNMIRAGEASGKMDEVCIKMANYYENQHRTKGDVKSAMTYPLILIVITIGVIVLIFTLIFPRLETVFDGMELPTLTQVMMAISHFIIEKWYILIIAVLVIAALTGAFRKNYNAMYSYDKLKLRLPKIKKLVGTIYTSRFARTLASLYSSGISILNSLIIAKNVIGNRYITAQFDEVIQKVQRGESLSVSLLGVDGFDKKLAQTIVVGEETGRMDSLLEAMSDSFEYESKNAIGKLIKLIEPIMICVIAAVILLVMMSVFMPIFDLYSTIEQAA